MDDNEFVVVGHRLVATGVGEVVVAGQEQLLVAERPERLDRLADHGERVAEADVVGADRRQRYAVGVRNKDAYARHTAPRPLPVWSGNRTRHRLARTGNRQLNCAIHGIAVTQGRCHPDARAFIARRTARGNTPSEARGALKRRLSDLVYRDLLHDKSIAKPHPSALGRST